MQRVQSHELADCSIARPPLLQSNSVEVLNQLAGRLRNKKKEATEIAATIASRDSRPALGQGGECRIDRCFGPLRTFVIFEIAARSA